MGDGCIDSCRSTIHPSTDEHPHQTPQKKSQRHLARLRLPGPKGQRSLSATTFNAGLEPDVQVRRSSTARDSESDDDVRPHVHTPSCRPSSQTSTHIHTQPNVNVNVNPGGRPGPAAQHHGRLGGGRGAGATGPETLPPLLPLPGLDPGGRRHHLAAFALQRGGRRWWEWGWEWEWPWVGGRGWGAVRERHVNFVHI